jgi:CheY-like chemotaxis protein
MTDGPATEPHDVTQRLALMCVDDPDRKSEVSAVLQELGYRVHLASAVPDAIERMRRNAYEVLVVDGEFQGATSLDHPLLRSIQWMPTASRRPMFVVLLSHDAKTFDNMAAFVQSVNLVVNMSDLAHLRTLLERAVSESDDFYRVFRQVLQAAGKR